MGSCPKHGRLPEDELWCPLCPEPSAVCHECGGPIEGKVSYPGDQTVYVCERCHEDAGERRCECCGAWRNALEIERLPEGELACAACRAEAQSRPHPAPTCRCPACVERRRGLNYADRLPPQGRSMDGKPGGDKP